MRDFQYVLYGKIELELLSFLHVGGEDESAFSLVTDGSGRYILPATSIAGSVKTWLSQCGFPVEMYLGDDQNEDSGSRVYYYDGICRNVTIERRNGIRIDKRYGTADGDGFHTAYHIGQGMRTELCLQAFAADEGEAGDLAEMFEAIAGGIQAKRLTFGGKRSNGAGVFRVTGTGRCLLNLADGNDFRKYLTGVGSIFSEISCETPVRPDAAIDGGPQAHCMIFELTAEIPDGLIVKSGEHGQMAKTFFGLQEMHDVNMKKNVDGRSCYYVPGSAVKGVIRSCAERTADYFGIPETLMQQLFGGTVDNVKYRGHMRVHDILVTDPCCSVVNRIQIDRWLGGVIQGAKMNMEVIATKPESPMIIRVQTDMEDEWQYKLLNGLVFLALRDMGLGLVPVGSGSSIGLGRLAGRELKIGGHIIHFKDKRLVFEDGGEGEMMIMEWLQALRDAGTEAGCESLCQ